MEVHLLVRAVALRIALLLLWFGAGARPGLASASTEIPRGLSRLRSFGDADGLHNLVVVSITQDAAGALWLATDDGAYRFDGERFTGFGLEEGLPTTTTLIVGVTPEGNACSGSRLGLVCWDGTRFSRAGTAGLPEVAITAILSRRRRMWVGTERGLYVRDGNGPFEPAAGWPSAAPASVDSLWADERGLVAGAGGEVLTSDGQGPWQTLDLGLAGDRINGVLRDPEGALWIRSLRHFWVLPAGASAAEDLSAGLPRSFDTFANATNMALGPRGEVWVGTDTGIAYRAADRWLLLGNDQGFQGSRTLFIDREGTTWIGAVGLFRWRGRGLIERFDPGNGLPGKTAWAFQRDADGVLWAGTDECLARMLDEKWQCLPGSENRAVRSFAFPPQGGVFLSGIPAELIYVDPVGTVSVLGHEMGEGKDQRLLQMAIGIEGDLWLATRHGLYRMADAVPGKIVRVTVPGISPAAIYASVLVDGPRLWAASTEGLVLIQGGDVSTAQRFTTANGFRVDAMRYLTRLANHQVCVGYGESVGVSCFSFRNQRLSVERHYDTSNGLSSGKVYFLGEDRWRRLWFGTGNGVDVFTEQGVEHFSERDGLAGNDSAANAFFSDDDDGSLWLGSVGGVSRVHAGEYHGPLLPPRSIIRGGSLGEHSLADLAHAPHGARQTSHDHSALTLEIGSDSLADPDRVELQVRLSPFEEQWSATTQRQARYPALLPGAYRVEVRSRVDKGAWGETVELRFVVLPAWWQTRWFLALMIAAALAVTGAVFSWLQRASLVTRTRQLGEQAAARQRALLDSVPDLLIVHRADEIIYLNRAVRTMIGVEIGPGALAKLRDLVHPQDVRAAIDLSLRARPLEADRAPEMLEVRVRAADGTWRIFELTSVLIDFGGVNAIVAAARDVTERHRLRAKLVVSDRMASLGTLAAGIAHEINNPLTYVIGNLQMVGEALADSADEDLTGALADAADGAERVRKIVLGLRAFSRSEEEKRGPIDLRSPLQAAIRLTANEVRHRARMVTELGEVPEIIADDGRLTQVFINLIVNGAHAIAAGRSDENRITVRSLTDAQGRAVVEICDTGKGMTPEIMARVFDPFFTTNDVGEGTGLGLSICHGIIEGIGGQIGMESAPGKGTTVRVIVPGIAKPAVEPSAPAVVAAEAVPAAAPRSRLLVIDDEPLVAEMLCRTLRREHEISVDSCGRDALQRILGGARFDAILSDVMMPNMTGLELFEELTRAVPDQARRMIFLSGGVFSTQTRARLDELGAPQLAKPVDNAELRRWVKRMVTGEPSGANGAGGSGAAEPGAGEPQQERAAAAIPG
jgi:PAS domain S-box-containing protein